jgi:iron complex transport system ATP-binding protein
VSVLDLSGVRVRRGARPVLDGVDATFGAGRLTVVIGPNGAGKSTLLTVAAGLLAPDAGLVRLGGAAVAGMPRRELAARRAYLPQSPRVDWPISVERVVALGLTAQLPAFGGLPAVWTTRIEAALARHDLLDLRDRPATALSGGELARVMLARATVGAPEVLIVDEPTAGLDPRHALDAGQRLRALAGEGRTVVVALHDLDLALRIADDAVAIRNGRIAAQGRAEDVFTDALLTDLYEVPTRVVRDAQGVHVRFLERDPRQA